MANIFDGKIMKNRKNGSLFLAILQLDFLSNKLNNRSFTIVLLISLLSFPALATDVNRVDTDKYVISSCNAFKMHTNNDKTLPCIAYIKGFFNGMLNAGNPNVAKIDERKKKPSTLVERAYANRVGKIAERKPLSYSCITVDEFKAVILENLSDDSANTFVSVKQLNAFLIKALTTACSFEQKSR